MIKLPKHISGCGPYGEGHLAGQKHQSQIDNEKLDHIVARLTQRKKSVSDGLREQELKTVLSIISNIRGQYE